MIELDRCVIGIEVKSKRRRTSGIGAFKKQYPRAKTIFIDRENYLRFEKEPVEFIREWAR